MSASAIYHGELRHRRHQPFARAFTHAVGMLYLDLDELPDVLAHPPLWSAERAAPGRFRRADHLGRGVQALKVAVAQRVAEAFGVAPTGPVRLLTTPRTFGHSFNPLSLFYCFAADGERVEFVVAEVTNTPWGERHVYVLDTRGERAPHLRAECTKAFHVSPFMPMDLRYAWAIAVPGAELSVAIRSLAADGQRLFDASLHLHRIPLTAGALNCLLIRFPLAAARTLALIYWHGLALRLRGAPHFRRP